MSRDIKIGLIGFGTIGSGVIKLLQKNKGLIGKRLGAKLVLKKVADIDIKTPRPVVLSHGQLTTNAKEVLNDPDIDIVIELMGGYEPARSFLLEAIRNEKHIVTANKALIAKHGNEIFKAVEEKGVRIGFEASVGGTIPIIKTLKEGLVANQIQSIYGIMNGTSNYILTKMTGEGRDFKSVLKEAQVMGYAEANPSFDVDGIDTLHKLAITLSLAYGKRVNLEDIYTEGISDIRQQDIEFAKELGYRIKLLAVAVNRGKLIEARIHPTMIPYNDLLANVNGNFNAFHIDGDASGAVFLYGQGSGMMPTASAVVSDLIDISRDILTGKPDRVPPRTLSERSIDDIQLMPFEQIVTNYYFRFSAVDRPGVLSNISGILGQNNISIAAVIQKGRKQRGAVPVVMTTYKSREKDVRQALLEIDHLDIVMGKTVIIRIEDDKL